MKLTETNKKAGGLVVGCIIGVMMILLAPILYPGPGDSPDANAQTAMTEISGDPNGDGSVNVGDAVYLINFVFKSGPPPVPIGDLEYARIMSEINGLAVDHQITLARLDTINESIQSLKNILGTVSILEDSWPEMPDGSTYYVTPDGSIIKHDFNLAGTSGSTQ